VVGIAADSLDIRIDRPAHRTAKLRAGKGINVPDTDLPISALTDKDIADLATVSEQADLVQFSFVREPADVIRLFDELRRIGDDRLGVVLKIETLEAFERLPQLILAAMRRRRVGVMIARGDLALEVDLASDSAPLHELTAALLGLGPALRWMRDPTRGGLASALNELAVPSGLGITLDELALPVRPPVAAACEILGIDPLYVANEGKLVAVVAAEVEEEALALLRAHPLGADARTVAEVTQEPPGMVVLRTAVGGERIVDLLVGDPLPRIC